METRLTPVREFVRTRKSGRTDRMVECVCECGNTVCITRDNFRSRRTRSCGCLLRDFCKSRANPKAAIHHALYPTWRNMRWRCRHKRGYVDRGISVCKRWDSFWSFVSDMGPRPSDSHTVDRIDNDGNYTPENCRWALPGIQSNNRRNNHRVTAGGVTLTLAQWARFGDTGLCERGLSMRIQNGWHPVDAVTIPKGVRRAK